MLDFLKKIKSLYKQIFWTPLVKFVLLPIYLNANKEKLSKKPKLNIVLTGFLRDFEITLPMLIWSFRELNFKLYIRSPYTRYDKDALGYSPIKLNSENIIKYCYRKEVELAFFDQKYHLFEDLKQKCKYANKDLIPTDRYFSFLAGLSSASEVFGKDIKLRGGTTLFLRPDLLYSKINVSQLLGKNNKYCLTLNKKRCYDNGLRFDDRFFMIRSKDIKELVAINKFALKEALPPKNIPLFPEDLLCNFFYSKKFEIVSDYFSKIDFINRGKARYEQKVGLTLSSLIDINQKIDLIRKQNYSEQFKKTVFLSIYDPEKHTDSDFSSKNLKWVNSIKEISH